MIRLADGDLEEVQLRQEMEDLRSAAHSLSSTPITSLYQGIETLGSLRQSIYENLNQLPHKYLLLRALRWLQTNRSPYFGSDWFWNPMQTGTATEPDLLWELKGRTVVSAEASASQGPVGRIAVRLKKTLEKLEWMEGELFYFALSDLMAIRARKYIREAGWKSEVVLISSYLDELTIKKAREINFHAQEYCRTSGKDVKPVELMFFLVDRGVFEKMDHRNGLPIRKILRAVDDAGRLDELMPTVTVRRLRNRQWYFNSI